MNRLVSSLLLLILSLCLCACHGTTPAGQNTAVKVNLVAHAHHEDGSVSGHLVSVDLETKTLTCSQDALFTVPGGDDWISQISPVFLSTQKIVLPVDPIEPPALPCTVERKMDTLYNKDNTLTYSEEAKTAQLHRGSQETVVLDMTVDGQFVTPQAFFVKENGDVAVLANTNGITYDLVYPVTLYYRQSGEGLVLEKTASFQALFEDETFSKINQPHYVPASSNIYGNAETGTFLWNETNKLVALNPTDGTHQVILTDQQVAQALPEIDMHREQMEFFSDVSYQNGIYLAEFPNYNGVTGTSIVFCQANGSYLGRVFCTEAALVLENATGEEVARIDNANLTGTLYLPQSPLSA